METRVVSIDRVKRAEIRYFEKEMNGVAIPEVRAYAILLRVNDSYISIVDPFKESNVWGRLPYTNSTSSGEDFGTKIRLLSGKEEDGVCYVLEPTLPTELTDLVQEGTDQIDIDDIYSYIANSKDFYYDRIDLIRKNPGLVKLGQARKIIDSDLEKQMDFVSGLVFDEKTYKK